MRVRINAYGTSSSNYTKDGHIWQCIETIERFSSEKPFCKNKFDNGKKVLIDFLSALLKYDWERSKRELFINFREVASACIILSLVFTGVCTETGAKLLNFAIHFMTSNPQYGNPFEQIGRLIAYIMLIGASIVPIKYLIRTMLYIVGMGFEFRNKFMG